MIDIRKTQLPSMFSRSGALISALACASLAMTACADLPPGTDDWADENEDGQEELDVHEAALETAEPRESAFQIFGPVGGSGTSAPTRPGLPSWPGTFGGVGSTGGRASPRPDLPSWPGGFGPVGGGGSPTLPGLPGRGSQGGSGRVGGSPRTPTLPGWPGGFGPVGGSGGSAPSRPAPRPGGGLSGVAGGG